MCKTLIAVFGAVALWSAGALASPQDVSPSGQPNAATPPQPEAPPPEVCPPGTVPVPGAPPAVPSEQPGYSEYGWNVPPAKERKSAFAPHQMAVSVGGGVGQFVRDRSSDNAAIAGAWSVKATFGTRSLFAFEAEYLGSAQNVYNPSATNTLDTTQVTGNARFNLTRSRIQPHLDAGAGWVNLHQFGPPEQMGAVVGSAWNKNENSLVLPMGGGLSGYVGRHTMVDARFDYRLITDKSITNMGARPDMWTALARLGYAF